MPLIGTIGSPGVGNVASRFIALMVQRNIYFTFSGIEYREFGPKNKFWTYPLPLKLGGGQIFFVAF